MTGRAVTLEPASAPTGHLQRRRPRSLRSRDCCAGRKQGRRCPRRSGSRITQALGSAAARGFGLSASASAAAPGSSTMKRAPPAGASSTRTAPPWSVTKSRTTARPMPVPATADVAADDEPRVRSPDACARVGRHAGTLIVDGDAPPKVVAPVDGDGDWSGPARRISRRCRAGSAGSAAGRRRRPGPRRRRARRA